MRVDARMLLPAVLAFAGAAVPAVPLAQEKSGQVVVEERRLPSDELIQAEVVQRLAANLRLEGRIGVESRNAVVTLSGWTRTSGQAWIAEEEARRVAGVSSGVSPVTTRMVPSSACSSPWVVNPCAPRAAATSPSR